MKEGRINIELVCIKDNLFAIGGEYRDRYLSTRVEKYSRASNAWQTVSYTPEAFLIIVRVPSCVTFTFWRILRLITMKKPI